MTTIPFTDSFGDSLTPFSLYEQWASQISWPCTIGFKHAFIENGQALLCQNPREQHRNSLEADVTCLACRELWSFKVNAEFYRTEKKEHKSTYTEIFEAWSCHCTHCVRAMKVFFNG